MIPLLQEWSSSAAATVYSQKKTAMNNKGGGSRSAGVGETSDGGFTIRS
jgi:hypothetical protein